MSRAPGKTDYQVHIEEIGTFTFARRTMRDQFRIQAEIARLTEGVSPVPDDLNIAASAVATIKTLTVVAPDGWDIDAMDPLEEDTYQKLVSVFGALRAREESFRSGSKAAGEAAGKGAGGDA
jgi:hypothetical protein